MEGSSRGNKVAGRSSCPRMPCMAGLAFTCASCGTNSMILANCTCACMQHRVSPSALIGWAVCRLTWAGGSNHDADGPIAARLLLSVPPVSDHLVLAAMYHCPNRDRGVSIGMTVIQIQYSRACTAAAAAAEVYAVSRLSLRCPSLHLPTVH